MSNSFWQEGRPQNGLTYAQYEELYEAEATVPPEESENPGMTAYTALNWKRTQRINKTFKVSEEAQAAMQTITSKQLWMVITEGACGDSAQSLPIIHKLAELNPLVEIRIILREPNMDIMNAYLTNGKQGIPKIIAFNSDGEELFRWGPRPQEGQQVFEGALAEGTPKGKAYEQLHLWYGRNRGKEVQREYVECVKSVGTKV